MHRHFKYFLIGLILTGCSTAGTIQQGSGNPGTSSSPKNSTGDQVPVFQRESPDDSGMWLLPQINGAVHGELRAKGLRLSPDLLYHPSKPSLNQAIARVNIGQSGGGTASFVSPKGLLLTNHHVAYDAIASASTPADNYLEEGFYADSPGDEKRARNYMLYIPIEQTEVTRQIRQNIPDSLNLNQRIRREQQVRNAIIQQQQAGQNDIVVEIHDFWGGNRQFMSVYRLIRDVRLVYAPPSSIGKYGGDIDNWQWPRHTGDFAFLRAYVAPDGRSRSYHPDNVPFEPGKFLPIDPDGVQQDSYTMVLGFPGQTFRHQSSHAFEFYYQVRNPILIESFDAILASLEYAASRDPQMAVNTASERASLANSLKYFRGVQKGFENYKILVKKRREEIAFEEWFRQDSLRKNRYQRVLPQLDQAFEIASQTGDLLYGTLYALNYSTLLQAGGVYSRYFEFIENPDSLNFTDSDKDSLLARHRALLETTNIEAETRLLKDMLHMLTTLPEGKIPLYLLQLFGDVKPGELETAIKEFLDQQHKESIVFDVQRAQALLNLPVEQAEQQFPDGMVRLFDEIRDAFLFSRQNYSKHIPYMQTARQLYVEGMLRSRNDSTEYPDANSTLRLSGGRVQGYAPADGIYHTPFTTFGGMIAKDTDEEPFDAPQYLEDYYSSFQNTDTVNTNFGLPNGNIPANFLSTNDITGGNSGSPVLNANGEIVGLAFDSNIEGIVGDYFYDPALNRTINVDIRYVLFLLHNFAETGHLLEELDIDS